MLALIVRRFVLRAPELRTRQATLLHPEARAGIQRDSAIVCVFILLHVGSRFVGESFALAHAGPDAWQPLRLVAGTAVVRLAARRRLTAAEHVAWWLALGLILAFVPYFPYSKHLHLFFAPLNFLLKPERPSIGELERLDFDDQTIEQFGVARLEDLAWTGLMDAYACIMCNRCQDACPAYQTGKVLSPAALEINKRYVLNREGTRLARGEASQPDAAGVRHLGRGRLGLHGLWRVHRHLPGGQRADARHPRDPPPSGADGECLPGAAADRLPRHGAHGQPVVDRLREAAGVGGRAARPHDCRATACRTSCGG